MKRSEALKKIRENENALEVKRIEKLRELESEMDLEARENNRTRARSINVGTCFGGTTEVIMRGDGGRLLWCAMQPVEVVELIHQLAANVGCNITLKPRQDFSSWREWRVSEAEKKHLNGHPPFVNDMVVFQNLGASGYDDAEAKRIMEIISNAKEFINENDDTKVYLQEDKSCGAPSLMVGEEDNLLHNKLLIDEDGELIYMSGGSGGDQSKKFLEDLKNEAMATKKSTD